MKLSCSKSTDSSQSFFHKSTGNQLDPIIILQCFFKRSGSSSFVCKFNPAPDIHTPPLYQILHNPFTIVLICPYLFWATHTLELIGRFQINCRSIAAIWRTLQLGNAQQYVWKVHCRLNLDFHGISRHQVTLLHSRCLAHIQVPGKIIQSLNLDSIQQTDLSI